jgi:glycosyltransferase involved in cell wall biosynthesis
MLTTSYPRFPGDYRGVFVKNLADAVRAQGVDVEIIEPRGYAALKGGAGLVPNLQSSMKARLLFPLYCLHFLLISIRSASRCDLLHANWSLSGFFAVLAGKVTGRRVIVTERGQFLIDSRNRWVNRWLGWVLGNASARVAISQSARDKLVEKFPDLAFHVIPNGVDDRRYSPHERDGARAELGLGDDVVHIVTVGRLTEVKRLHTLIGALSRLGGCGVGFRGWVVGGGEQHQSLQAAITEAGLDGTVTLLGARPPEETARWMAAADIFVLCSEGEGGGNVILEAMSAGLAVVSTPVGWAKDFIRDGENGRHVPVGDEKALEQALADLLQDPQRVKHLGAAARRTIADEKLNWSGCAQRYHWLYQELTD